MKKRVWDMCVEQKCEIEKKQKSLDERITYLGGLNGQGQGKGGIRVRTV